MAEIPFKIHDFTVGDFNKIRFNKFIEIASFQFGIFRIKYSKYP